MSTPPGIWVSMPDEYSIRSVQVGPWTTRVLEAGQPDRPAVVLMAGTGGHLEAYTRNIAALAHDHRVIAYDYPGHGHTTPATRDLELTDYVQHLRQLLDVLGIERAHLNGESLGGWVALKFAVAHPERANRLVLNTPGGTMADPVVMERIRTLSQAAADDPTPERVRARLEWLMADPRSVTDELVDVRRRIYSQPGFARSMQHILCLQDVDVRRRNQVTDAELAAIHHPSLVVWTSDDPSGPEATGRRMAEALPNGSFRSISGAGHWPQWEQAGTFNATVADFLDAPAVSTDPTTTPATERSQ